MKIDRTDTEAQCPWPEGVYLQGGKSGLVVSKGGNHYTTAFVEAFPGGTFIRGEGETIADAEKAAWEKFQRREQCPGHEWEARNYKNGAGFCKHCGAFGSKVFTPEDLGLSCNTCGVPTYYDRVGDTFFCEEHAKSRDALWLKEERRKQFRLGKVDTLTGSMIGDLIDALEQRQKG